MSLSVSIGRIINDPTASVLTRNALGLLSTAALLVHDTGITIDDDGRITLRLKPDGGLSQDETGVFVEGIIQVDSFAIDDSEVEVAITLEIQDGLDRWNLYVSGTAPNYFRGDVRIGTTDAAAKLTVESITDQLRLLYDEDNYLKLPVDSDGNTSIEPVGSNADLKFITRRGSNVKINGRVVPRFLTATVSWTYQFYPPYVQEKTVTVVGAEIGDTVVACPIGQGFITGDGTFGYFGTAAWCGFVSDVDTVTIRIDSVGSGVHAYDPVTSPWRVTVIKAL